MIAVARISLVLPFTTALVMGLGGCDLSQKKPETVAAKLVTQRVEGAQAAGEAQAGPTPEGPGSERSVRLYGRGVSRQLQTRI